MTALNDEQRAFLEANHGATMITLRADGTPHAVRVGVVLVDGKIWSSGTQGRARTRHLRRDPRSTLLVWPSGFGYLTIESTVTILEGPDVPELSLRLFRVMQNRPTGDVVWNGKPIDDDGFKTRMVEEERVIYEFEPRRVYGFGLSLG
jgi:PPOX class probable F420-dependent enzyme